MAKNESWRPRKSRKRGFDDDGPEFGGWAPPPPAAGGGPPAPLRQSSVFSSGPEIKAVVKWFNGEKGFGFVELGDGSGDAFLHVSVVQRAGADVVQPGANLRVKVGPGQKGQQVTEVLEITEGEAPPPRPVASAAPRARPMAAVAASAATVRAAAVAAASSPPARPRRCVAR
jgi:cold shock protein